MGRSTITSAAVYLAAILVGAIAGGSRRAEPARPKPSKPGSFDRAAVLAEIQDFSLAGFERRLGPDYDSYHQNDKKAEKFSVIWSVTNKPGPGNRRYQIGGPWQADAGDFSSTQGQILHVPDDGVGVDRVTILEWTNGGFSERPVSGGGEGGWRLGTRDWGTARILISSPSGSWNCSRPRGPSPKALLSY